MTDTLIQDMQARIATLEAENKRLKSERSVVIESVRRAGYAMDDPMSAVSAMANELRSVRGINAVEDATICIYCNRSALEVGTAIAKFGSGTPVCIDCYLSTHSALPFEDDTESDQSEAVFGVDKHGCITGDNPDLTLKKGTCEECGFSDVLVTTNAQGKKVCGGCAIMAGINATRQNK